MRAGQFRMRVDIEQFNKVADDLGHPDATASTWKCVYESVPASITSVSGREQEFQNQTAPTATHIVKIRYLCGIDESMRLNWGGRIFGIGAILVGDMTQGGFDNRERNIQFLCTELKGE